MKTTFTKTTFTKTFTTAAASGLAAATLLGGLAFSATSAAAAEPTGGTAVAAPSVQLIFEDARTGTFRFLSDPRDKGTFRWFYDTAATLRDARAAAPHYTVSPVDGGFNLLKDGRCVAGAIVLWTDASDRACAVVRFADGELQMREGWQSEGDFAGIKGVTMMEVVPGGGAPRHLRWGFTTRGPNSTSDGVGRLTYVGPTAGLVPLVVTTTR